MHRNLKLCSTQPLSNIPSKTRTFSHIDEVTSTPNRPTTANSVVFFGGGMNSEHKTEEIFLLTNTNNYSIPFPFPNSDLSSMTKMNSFSEPLLMNSFDNHALHLEGSEQHYPIFPNGSITSIGSPQLNTYVETLTPTLVADQLPPNFTHTLSSSSEGMEKYDHPYSHPHYQEKSESPYEIESQFYERNFNIRDNGTEFNDTMGNYTCLDGTCIPTNYEESILLNSEVTNDPINHLHRTSPKKYQCLICQKSFSRPSSLTTHIYSHTGEKPFRCPFDNCGKHFSVLSNLRRHTKIHNIKRT